MSQVATSPQTFTVAAASAGVALVQPVVFGKMNGSGTMTATLASKATSGNVLTLVVGGRTNDAFTDPTTLGYTLGPKFLNSSSFSASCWIYFKVSDGTEQAVTITGSASRGSIALYEVSGVSTTFASYISAGAQNAAGTGTGTAIPMISTTAAALVISASCYSSTASDSTIDAPWTVDVLTTGYNGIICAHQIVSGATAITGTIYRTGGGGLPANAMITLAIQ